MGHAAPALLLTHKWQKTTSFFEIHVSASVKFSNTFNFQLVVIFQLVSDFSAGRVQGFSSLDLQVLSEPICFNMALAGMKLAQCNHDKIYPMCLMK